MSKFQQQQYTPEPNTFPVYSKDFILRPYLVMQHSNKSKKQMQDFIQAFNKRIETQLTYQKNLNQCAKMLEKYIDPNTEKCLSYISSAFKVDNQQRGNQAKQLAQSLRTQVIQPMNQSYKKYTNLTKKAQKGFKKLNKDYTYFMDNFRRAKQNYNQNDNQTKQMIITKNIYKYTSQFSQDKKNKLISKTMESIRQKMEYQKLYKSSVNQLNQIVEIYQKEAIQMLNQLQLVQREQIKLQSDAIRKLIVCQVSMFKNVQYDLINISKQMQKMYGENDIQQFKKQAYNNINQSDKDIKDMSLKNIEFDKSLLSLSLKNVQEDYYVWTLGLKKNKIMRKIMEMRMKQLNPQIQNKKGNQQIVTQQVQKQQEKITKPQTKQQQPNPIQAPQKTLSNQWQYLPKQTFNPPPNPNGIYQKISSEQCYQDFIDLTQIINKVWSKNQQFTADLKNTFIKFLQKNHFLRIVAYLFIEQYRIQHRVLMAWANYEKAGQLSKILVDYCDKFGDVFTLKGLLALMFTFYSIKDEKSKKLMYQMPIISQCQIWKKEDYWEASLFQSTYEQMVNFNVQKGETHSQTLLRQKNIIFSQLASYCHYMLMLNIGSKNVRRIVGRYCRLYQMTQDQNRDLSKMISNTIKQLKQVNSATTTTSNESATNNVTTQ